MAKKLKNGKTGTNSRRDFLALSGKLVVGACGLGALGISARMATPDFVDGPPDRFALGAVADFKVNTQTWIRERDLFVLRDGRGLGALSARCTHLGCTVRRVAEGFACPCHGARFDSAGRVLSGPARDPLPWFELRLGLDGRLWVDVSSNVAPGTVALADLEASG